MINQQELEAKIIELSLWSRGSFGKSCFYGQLLVDLSSFNWNKYDGLEQICRLRNLIASIASVKYCIKTMMQPNVKTKSANIAIYSPI